MARKKQQLQLSTREVRELAFEIIRSWGSQGGKIGGKVRAQRLTPEQRTASARKAARARWSKKRKPSR